jgi:REP element-mobilizing transposase RayT
MDIIPVLVHLLLNIDPKIVVYSVVSKIKGYTSK